MKRWIFGLAAFGLIAGGAGQRAAGGIITVTADPITIVEGLTGDLVFKVTNTGGADVTYRGNGMYKFTLIDGESDDAVVKVVEDGTSPSTNLAPGESVTFKLLVTTSASHADEIPQDNPISKWQVQTTVAFADENGPNTQTGTGVVFVPDVAAPALPEPASLTLLGIGIAGMAGYGWRRRKQVVA